MRPQEISKRILEISKDHGLPTLKVRPRRQVWLARLAERVARLVNPVSDRARTYGNTITVPHGTYWNPPPPHILIHELVHKEQAQRLGRLRYILMYGSLGLLHTLATPILLVPTLLSLLIPSVRAAQGVVLATLASELVCLAYCSLEAALAALGMLLVSYAPFMSTSRAQLEIEAHVMDALYSAWSQDMAWSPQLLQRYGSLSVHRLRWIHDTITGPETFWAVKRSKGKRMLVQVARDPETLIERYPRVFGIWLQLHREYLQVAEAAKTNSKPTAKTDTTPDP